MNRVTKGETPRWPKWLNAALLLAVSWLALGLLSFNSRADADIVAAMFPPWWSAQRAIEAAGAAGAAMVRSTAIPAIVVVRPAEHDGWQRLRRQGAWLALDPQAITACFSDTQKAF